MPCDSSGVCAPKAEGRIPLVATQIDRFASRAKAGQQLELHGAGVLKLAQQREIELLKRPLSRNRCVCDGALAEVVA